MNEKFKNFTVPVKSDLGLLLEPREFFFLRSAAGSTGAFAFGKFRSKSTVVAEKSSRHQVFFFGIRGVVVECG